MIDNETGSAAEAHRAESTPDAATAQQQVRPEPNPAGHRFALDVAGLSDAELAGLLRRVDPALRRALRCLSPAPLELDLARVVVATARIEHRKRCGRADVVALLRVLERVGTS
jgi:hypothetical protein